MRPPNHPGTVFLRAAAHLFDAAVVERVFVPAVADLQAEWRATTGRFARVRVRVRGGLSLFVLAVVTPFHVSASLDAGEVAAVRPSAGGWFLVVLASTLYAATFPLLGPFSVPSALLGVAVACAVRAWRARHPSDLTDALRRRPNATAEINLSAIPVAGDLAGLMFALGSVSIVVIGLPGMPWYVLGVVVGSAIAAVTLRAWHTRSRKAHQDGLLHLR
jgi:hypothetical protein